MVNGTSMCQTKKLATCGVSKIYEWILRDTYRWVKLSKGVTDDGYNYWGIFFKIIVNVIWMSQSKNIYLWGLKKLWMDT